MPRKTSLKGKSKGAKDNDTELHPCGLCSKACLDEFENNEDDSIICDNCSKWFHRKCVDILSDSEWDLLTGHNPSILFKCRNCVGEKGDKNKEIKELKQNMNNFRNDFNNMLEDNNKKLVLEIEKNLMPRVEEIINKKIKAYSTELEKKYDDKIKYLENEVKQNKEKVLKNEQKPSQANLEKMIEDVKKTEVELEKKIESELKVYLNKKEDKENRKNNIIIMKLEENNGENEEERTNKDRIEIKKLLNVTNPELEAELENAIPKKTSLRLGKKKDGINRPIKLVLPDEEMKIEIFKGCKKLKNSAFNHISIQNDLTREEQETNYKMRQELRQRKEKGEKVCIYKNEIIPECEHPRNRRKLEAQSSTA